jgi:glycerol-3-phosphate dehydrogenase (NAD(P)+)
MATIAIVGAGYMGTATAWPLTDNGHAVRLVGTHLDGDIITSCLEQRYHPKLKRKLPEGVYPFYVEDVAQAINGADVIVSGVNSMGVHWIGQTIGPHLQPGQLVIAVTKGLVATEKGDLQILPDVLRDELPETIRHRAKLAAIGGPCIAGELAGRRQTCVVFGSRDNDTVERLAALFRTSYYHVWTTTDLVGLEYCAALKNCYTLAAGMAAGLLERDGGIDDAGAHMHNLAAAVFAQACTEMERLLQMMGATRAFAYWLPGAGDLFVTVQGGRSVSLGRLVGLGHTYDEARNLMQEETLEAAFVVQQLGEALPKLTARGIVAPDDFPLMRALVNTIVHDQPIDLPLEAFGREVNRIQTT